MIVVYLVRMVGAYAMPANEPGEKVTFLKTASFAESKIANYFLLSKFLQSLVQCSSFHDIFLTATPYHPIQFVHANSGP